MANTLDELGFPTIVTICKFTITTNTGRDESVKHSLDVWHGAKNLGKKLSQVSF